MNNVSAYVLLHRVSKNKERERERPSPSHRPLIPFSTYPFSPSSHPFFYLPLLAIPSSLSLLSHSHHPIIPFYTFHFSPSLPVSTISLLTHPSPLSLSIPSHTFLILSLSSAYSHLTSLSTSPLLIPPSPLSLPSPFSPPTPPPSFVSKAVGRGSGCRRIDDYLTKRDGLVRNTGTHLQIVL